MDNRTIFLGTPGRLSRPSAWHLGWSLLLTWVFCVFHFRSTDVSRGGSDLASAGTSLVSDLVHAGAPLAFSILTLVVIALFELRICSLVDHLRLFVACPMLATLGTLSILLSIGGPVGEASFLGGLPSYGRGVGVPCGSCGASCTRVSSRASPRPLRPSRLSSPWDARSSA